MHELRRTRGRDEGKRTHLVDEVLHAVLVHEAVGVLVHRRVHERSQVEERVAVERELVVADGVRVGGGDAVRGDGELGDGLGAVVLVGGLARDRVRRVAAEHLVDGLLAVAVRRRVLARLRNDAVGVDVAAEHVGLAVGELSEVEKWGGGATRWSRWARARRRFWLGRLVDGLLVSS